MHSTRSHSRAPADLVASGSSLVGWLAKGLSPSGWLSRENASTAVRPGLWSWAGADGRETVATREGPGRAPPGGGSPTCRQCRPVRPAGTCRSLDAVIGVEAGLDALIGEAHTIELDPMELRGRFPDGVMTSDAMQRAATPGLVEPHGCRPASRLWDCGTVELCRGTMTL